MDSPTTRKRVEINRRLRHVKFIRYWKATEFRTFLHYVSIIVFKDFMWEEAFNHFLLYFSAITIFSSTKHHHLWALAKKMLYKFVKDFANFYGRSNLTSNVHNLIHIYDDVDRFGPLDKISAYVFENHLQFIKRCIRSGNRCLEQVITRGREFENIKRAYHIITPTYPKLLANGSGLQVRDDFCLTANFKNQWFLSHENCIVQFLEAKESASSSSSSSSSSFTIVGLQYKCCEEMYKVSIEGDTISPVELSSTALYIYKVRNNTPRRRVELPHQTIKCKLVAIRLPSQSLARRPVQPTIPSTTTVFFPLLHTF
ncbi:uncharacterized protein LOC118516445 isoform X1 [Anopheles stephensi]|uniref:uncharacterized protein LOC118516445 isoform X1 n=1 Tax=Anopheles stephensi TaxID=30069 RepID=UPI001658900E|nr:uncharacterized protein LOC118516445 isoform X1 [Anopheles stephensi]